MRCGLVRTVASTTWSTRVGACRRSPCRVRPAGGPHQARACAPSTPRRSSSLTRHDSAPSMAPLRVLRVCMGGASVARRSPPGRRSSSHERVAHQHHRSRSNRTEGVQCTRSELLHAAVGRAIVCGQSRVASSGHRRSLPSSALGRAGRHRHAPDGRRCNFAESRVVCCSSSFRSRNRFSSPPATCRPPSAGSHGQVALVADSRHRRNALASRRPSAEQRASVFD